jgi:Co/Zn/Cd efflux system component
VGLLRSTSAILLDRTAPDSVSETVRASIESVHDNRVADLHVWSVGPGIYSAIVSVVTHHPQEPGFYKDLIPLGAGIVHVCVEVHECE